MEPVLSLTKIDKGRTPEEWKAITAQMEAKGIVNPYKDIEAMVEVFRKEGRIGGAEPTPKIITLSNALTATVVLRMAELAQPLVNILSLPILTSGAINRKMASSFMGTEIASDAKFSVTATMIEGMRLMNHPVEGVKWSKIAEANNLFSPDWREVNGILQQSKNLETGLLASVEKGLESKLVKTLSWGADQSEQLARRVAFYNGVALAKKAYPGISDAGIMTFARNFMDEAIGNYASAQRPALFQGTLGTAMGLFQTYMLTLGQQMYRGIEARQWASLGKQLLTQQSIFGSASLPGFHPVSEAIGNNFSDNNFDLTTGTFRALPNKLSEILLYGLPSQLVGITTRGDIQPRVPNPLQGLDSIVAVNTTKQAYEGLERVVKAAFSADENTGKAMLEALSLQSISRPVARISEMISGHSITKTGRIIQNNLTLNPFAEDADVLGILSRAMATRPLEEIKAREADHLNTLYSAANSKERREVTSKLRSYIVNGNLDSEKLESLAEEYMRTGNPSGWRAAVNDAIKQAGATNTDNATRHLRPDAAVMRMMEDLD
jgi:hypothetical protein